jgi:hypothetical protein
VWNGEIAKGQGAVTSWSGLNDSQRYVANHGNTCTAQKTWARLRNICNLQFGLASPLVHIKINHVFFAGYRINIGRLEYVLTLKHHLTSIIITQ